jgi:hypothetical protein
MKNQYTGQKRHLASVSSKARFFAVPNWSALGFFSAIASQTRSCALSAHACAVPHFFAPAAQKIHLAVSRKFLFLL